MQRSDLVLTSFLRERPSLNALREIIYSELATIVGDDDISDEESDLLSYSNYDIIYPSVIGKTEMIRFSDVAPGEYILTIGDFVVYPETTEEVREIVKLANKYKIPIVPYAGGSGLGHNPVFGGIIVDLRKLDRIIEIDEVSHVATVESGIYIADLEDELNRKGFTMEHFPASYYCACLGGFIANRSAGRLSTKYGKIESMVIGMKIVLPTGDVLNTPAVPAHAVGPDLNQLFIGSGGTLGIVTEATINIYPIPEKRTFRAVIFPSLAKGFEAMRRIMQADLQPCLARLYDPIETTSDLFTESLVPKNLVPKIRKKKGFCYLIIGFDGNSKMVRIQEKLALDICLEEKGEDLGNEAGQFFWDHSLDDYYPGFKRPSRSSQFFSQDAPAVGDVYDYIVLHKEMMSVWKESTEELRKKYRDSIMYGHFSHWYKTGGMMYPMVYAWNIADNPKALRRTKDTIRDIVLQTVLKHGGAFQHHHGVSIELAKYMRDQWGETGYKLLRDFKKILDPNNIMNPGQMGL